MKKTIHLILVSLLFFSGTIGGQNGYYLTSIDRQFAESNQVGVIEIAVEATWELEISPTVKPTYNKAQTSYFNSFQQLFDGEYLAPAIIRNTAILENNWKLYTSPMHALRNQTTETISVLPKQTLHPVTIDKRPKSFGPLYAF